VDYSARIQTVHKDTNPRYHALISKFKELTGCPVLVNTSFNVRGEPIVCTPEDAFRCFMGTEIELLAIGNCLLRKDDQDASLLVDYQNVYELD
jgi:carbamoyltransferase